MSYLDYIILLVLSIGFLLGAKDGFVRKVIGVTGLIAAIFLAFYFSGSVGALLAENFISDIYLSEIVAGVLIFIIAIVITSILKRVIHPLDKVNKFVNQFLGGIAGALQLVVFLGVLFFVLNIFGIPSQEDKDESYLYRPVYRAIPATISFFMGDDFKAKEYFEDKIQHRDLEDEIINQDSLDLE